MFNLVKNLFKLNPITASTLTKITSETGIISRKLYLTSVSSALSRTKQNVTLRTLRNLKSYKNQTDANEYIDNYSSVNSKDCFPDENTPNLLFDGIPFKKLPIFNIKACKNNTIISVTDYDGKVVMLKSCGTEGFKTSRKGTNVAAQATGFNISKEALERGIKTARIRIQGLGPGRMSALKGLQIGGTNIISITDNTHVSWAPPRPRKRRRV